MPLTFSALTAPPGLYLAVGRARNDPAHPARARGRRAGDRSRNGKLMAKLVQGIADDLLTNAALAARIPIVIAPAMNSAMYEHPATVRNLRELRARGVRIVEPGRVFWPSARRVPDVSPIKTRSSRRSTPRAAHVHELDGERVLITAGPTREAIDPVRFLSNASTGTTGIELAREALARGATVDLVLGPDAGAAAARRERASRGQRARDVRRGDASCGPSGHRDRNRRSRGFAAGYTLRAQSEKRRRRRYDRTRAHARYAGRTRGGKRGTFLVGFAAETDDLEA